MQRFKLTVILLFAIFVSFAVFYDRIERGVEGQNIGMTLDAPGGVKASDSAYAAKVGVYWETVRNATLYRILRNVTNDPASATSIGTTEANFYFDPTVTPGQQYYYWIQAENSQTTARSASDAGMAAIAAGPPDNGFPLLETPVAPAANQITATKAYLGKALFWDEQLSSTKTVACGTCHRPAEGGSDPRTDQTTRNPGFDNTYGTADDMFGSPGVPRNNADGTYYPAPNFGMDIQVTGRKSPSYLNAGYTRNGLFWDGRATDEFRDPLTNILVVASYGGLESQSVGPPVSNAEMGHMGRDWTQVASRVAVSRPLALAHDVPSGLAAWIGDRTYPELFQEAFGSPDVTPARIAMAIATHERTLFTDQTPLDQWSQQIGQLTPTENVGRQLFTELICNACHGGSLLSDNAYHNIGVRPAVEDRGRGAITQTTDDDARFKSPSLRNVELRAPFMHNGRFATLDEVVEFYNRGGDFDAVNIDHDLIRPLNLSDDQKAALVAFLKRPLTDPRVANELPPFDRPKLFTESTNVPTITGSGRAGTSAITPNAIAIEPPVLDNPSFNISVSNALAGANAVLVVDSADPGVGATIPVSGSFARVQTTTLGTGTDGYASAVLSIPNNPVLSGRTFYGRWYITDAAAANGFSVSKLITFKIFGGTAHRTPFDFDGDGKTDIGIFRPSNAQWWYSRSSDGQVRAVQFGASTDVIAPGDITGDGKADITFFRPSEGFWYVLRSEDNSFFSFPFGANGDVPMPADYDADGKTDVAVFRSGTWYILQTGGGGTAIFQFGASGDVPVSADYDGDGKADVAIYRVSDGSWWILRSSNGTTQIANFGSSTDKPVPGDYTGDGKADVAVFRPSTGEWFILRSENGTYFSFGWGANGDIAAPGDYDGDGKFDAAIFRPSTATWYVNRTTGSPLITQFGSNGDRPIPNAFVP